MAETHARAGTPARSEDLVDVPHLVTAYYTEHPDPGVPEHRVSFGTSGHRGSSLRCTFNEDHVLAISQAICDHRVAAGIDGPLFLARDTHALSEPAMVSALEVFAANGVEVLIDSRDGYTPTPALSHAVLTHNRGRTSGRADGVVISPSHNPPADGGFKYNPPDGGPAGSDITAAIEARANELLAGGLREVRRIPITRARSAETTGTYDFLGAYVDDLPSVIDIEAIRQAGVRIGADPLGGASVAYWAEIASRCLTCANCTMVCPTCFCTSVTDTTDLTGDHAERWQTWASCFDVEFSYLHGGSVRTSARSRYRQWLTHKLGTWHDQFGESGCVGCGRCIAWCPAGIDITAEVRALAAQGATA